ncbi:MAG: NlpC/P60 family protein [Clostridiales bacterium]|nr:NlpC/P60 family protein [Clostridiales bacterium]
MAERKFEASDKKVQKMSREGLTEENLHSGERQRVSTRTADAVPERIQDDGSATLYRHGAQPFDTDAGSGSKRKQRPRHVPNDAAEEPASYPMEEPSERAAPSMDGYRVEPADVPVTNQETNQRPSAAETQEVSRNAVETVEPDISGGDTKLSAQSVRMEGVREHSAGGAALQTVVETRHSRHKKQAQDYQAFESKSPDKPEAVNTSHTEDGAEEPAGVANETEPVKDHGRNSALHSEPARDSAYRTERNRQDRQIQQDGKAEGSDPSRPRRLSETIMVNEEDLSDYREEIGKKSKRERLFREQRKNQTKAKSTAARSPGQTEEAAKKAGRLSFDDECDSMVLGAGMGIGRKAIAGAAAVAAGYAHTKLHEAEQDNSAVEGAHQAEILTENSVRRVAARTDTHQTDAKSRRQVKQETETAKKSGRLQFSEEEGAAGTDIAGGKASKEAAEKKQAVKHFWQKKQYKEAYTAAKQGKTVTGDAAKATSSLTSKIGEKAKVIVQNNKGLLASLGVLILLLILVSVGLSSCAATFQGLQNSFVSTTYASTDDDIYATEDAYAALEMALDSQINNMESTHPGYDEYNYQIDEISHNPYQLISYLTTKYGEFTYAQVSSELETLFAQQYSLTVEEVIEIRTRTETMTGTITTYDPETGETTEEEYEYEVEVEYEYKILNITLVNYGLDATVRSSMTTEEASLYALYNSTYGNRSYLFDTSTLSTYSGSSGFGYEVSAEALSDEKFARMIAEAEKYLGYPYVWGGSSPSTSFDCSGFVCWVINNCGNGWNVGRTTADGLRSYCSYVSPEDAQPGDLIFFQGTYSTSGASHVGIYVGDGMMIHCGSPIQYTSIETSYWQSHFLAFGRLQ